MALNVNMINLNKMKKRARVIAFYLPQFHPIPENDEHWGKGFTEWTNVALAKPLFKGHYQPHIPADLGFYDLRFSNVRKEQSRLAKEAGIEGFCYWHYWMGKGKMLLETPFQEVLNSGNPDFPFCLGWANGDWTTAGWKQDGLMAKDRMICQQYYSIEDYKDHFYHVLPAFKDKRYIQVDGKPLFYVHDPLYVPHMKKFIELWQCLAHENGLKGIYFIGRANNISHWIYDEEGNRKYDPNIDVNNPHKYHKPVLELGFDAINTTGMDRAELILGGKFLKIASKIVERLFKTSFLRKFSQKDVNKYLLTEEDTKENIYPTIIPNWDRSPRQRKLSVIYTDSTPAVFDKLLCRALKCVEGKKDEHKIIFLRAWNEWAEGNHIEPDLKYGHGYLDVLKKCLIK